MRRIYLTATVLLTTLLACSCSTPTTPTTYSHTQSYGSGAQIVIRAELKPSTPESVANGLTQKIINVTGVAYCNYLAGDTAVIIGVVSTSQLSGVETSILKIPGIARVSVDSTPSAYPTGKPTGP